MNNTTKAAQVEKQAVDEGELARINAHTLRELSAEEKQQMEESLIQIVLHGLAQK